MAEQAFDVVVIGAGPAGVSGLRVDAPARGSRARADHERVREDDA